MMYTCFDSTERPVDHTRDLFVFHSGKPVQDENFAFFLRKPIERQCQQVMAFDSLEQL